MTLPSVAPHPRHEGLREHRYALVRPPGSTLKWSDGQFQSYLQRSQHWVNAHFIIQPHPHLALVLPAVALVCYLKGSNDGSYSLGLFPSIMYARSFNLLRKTDRYYCRMMVSS